MNIQHGKLWKAVLLALGFLLVGQATAHAAAIGVATGTFSFWNKNGNYCPTNANCTGTRYPQSVFNTQQPVANATVKLFARSSTSDPVGTLVGEGSTNDSGAFTIAWTASGNPTQLAAAVYTTQKDGRFYLANTAGQQMGSISGWVNRAAVTTALGGWVVGSSTAPNAYFNAYWAGELLWRRVLANVGTNLADFTNVEVRGFQDNIPGFLGNATSSVAEGATRRVQLDSAAGFAPQARVMHELGHIASYVTHPWQFTRDYTWAPSSPPGAPEPGAAGKWQFTTAEWGVSGFEEAFATHYGSVAFWNDNSVNPTSCLSTGTCYSPSTGNPIGGTDIEATSYPYATNNCSVATANPEARWPVSVMRFLWDVYDARNDTENDAYSASTGGHFWQHLAMFAFYPDGTDTFQINEPWNSGLTAVTQKDGRGAVSYANNYVSTLGSTTLSVAFLRFDNCAAP